MNLQPPPNQFVLYRKAAVKGHSWHVPGRIVLVDDVEPRYDAHVLSIYHARGAATQGMLLACQWEMGQSDRRTFLAKPLSTRKDIAAKRGFFIETFELHHLENIEFLKAFAAVVTAIHASSTKPR